jgi:hypothetical protein
MNFLGTFSKKSQMSSFVKMRPVGAELFHADGRRNGRTDTQTDMTKLIVAFRNFANSPKNSTLLLRKCVCVFLGISEETVIICLHKIEVGLFDPHGVCLLSVKAESLNVI